MRFRRRKIWWALPVVLIIVLLVAFGAGNSSGPVFDGMSDTRNAGSQETTGSSAPGAASDTASGGGGVAYDSDSSGAKSSQDGGNAIFAGWDQRVIRNATLILAVTNVEQAVAFARETAASAGGGVLSSTTRLEDDRQVAQLTLAVPSDQFDSVMTQLRTSQLVDTVEAETTSSSDVTEEFIDLQARLRTLETKEQRYLALLQQATALENILRLEEELAQVRGEIERIQGRLNYLDQRTAFSRIDLTLHPVGVPSSEPTQGAFNFERVVSEAWEASMRFVGVVLTAVITVVIFFWWLWPLAIVAGVVGLTIRGRRQREEAAGTATD